MDFPVFIIPLLEIIECIFSGRIVKGGGSSVVLSLLYPCFSGPGVV